MKVSALTAIATPIPFKTNGTEIRRPCRTNYVETGRESKQRHDSPQAEDGSRVTRKTGGGCRLSTPCDGHTFCDLRQFTTQTAWKAAVCQAVTSSENVILRATANEACVKIRIKVNGAPTRTRTADLLITNQLLYQLSYRGAGRWNTQITEILQVKIRAFFVCLFQKCEAV